MRSYKKPIALPCKQITAIADCTARRYGLRSVTYAVVRAMYDAAIPLPIHTCCVEGDLWVDKFYVAYQISDGQINYAYLTRTHIGEEMGSYMDASTSRRIKLAPPPDVLRCFRRAYAVMEASGENIWVFSRKTSS